MLQRILLVFFGSSLACLAAGGLYLLVAPSLPSGAQFQSVEELQRAMLQRDERDNKKGGSVSLRSIVTPHHDPNIIYDLLPGLVSRFQGQPLQVNNCGMRGYEREVEKASAEVFRIALLGDSFAFGWGVEFSESFSEQLPRVLSKLFPDYDFEVLNFGVPGYSTFQQVALFEERVLDFQPDALLLFFVENDFGLPFFIQPEAGQGMLSSVNSFLSRAKKDEQEKARKHQRELEQRADPNRALQRLERIAQREGIWSFVAINPRPDWREDAKKLWALRESRGFLQSLNLRRNFVQLYESRGHKAEELSLPDDPHPSVIKHAMLAEIIAGQMQPFLDAEFETERLS